MLLPARTAVLNYLYGVKSADIKEIMGELLNLQMKEKINITLKIN